MDLIAYQGKVKEFKVSDIVTFLLNIQVGAQDITGNMESLKANNIDLGTWAGNWVITKGLQKHFEAAGFRNSAFIDNIFHCLKAVETLVPELIKQVKGYKEQIWHGSVMTLKQLNILNVAEYLSFWVKYTAMMLDVLLTLETKGTAPESYLSKDNTRWLSGTEAMYRSFSMDLMKGSRHIVSSLEKIPDAEVNANSLSVMNATSDFTTDLLQKGFGIHLVNPAFWLSLGWSKIQLMRIENMRRKNQLFAMKISQAINKRNQAPSPQLDREIEIYQDAIIKNEAKIESIEADYV